MNIFTNPCIYKFLCLKSIDVYALGKNILKSKKLWHFKNI
jgi:hypothetical protein